MKLLILGATGLVGGWTARKALEHGHQLTLYVRDENRVPDGIKEKNVTIIQGSVEDQASLSMAIQGQDAILSSIGPSGWADVPGQITRGYKLILDLMRQYNVRRILAMGTISTYDPQDKPSFYRSCLYWLIFLIARGAQKEMLGIERAFREDGDDLDWTLCRVGLLGNSKEDGGVAEAGWVGDGAWSPLTERRDWANWMVQEVEKETPTWVREMPAIYTPKKRKTN
ncbi:hypothetical protein AJ79_04494 [Helicocarpus griseus UAMH5409]|uniref:NAD(P)-binding domain-containing protein n=1 Tax=Helicocarpus griseus UAMH5409 TaxID=1447875 RepID=A0A2B7XT25_9EURO|nr:hypothetical protein AJ79_04494 [Helicocarpus griseus UAMH5409]